MVEATDQLEADPSALGLVSHWADTSFGKLHYVSPNRRQSPRVVLFLHSYGASWEVWAPVVRAAQNKELLADKDIVLIDLPGFNKSDNRKDSLPAADVGRELLGLLEELGYQHIEVAGHSMGGFLALDITARNPRMIKACYVVSGTYLSLMRVVRRPVANVASAPVPALFYWVQRYFAERPQATEKLNRRLGATSLLKQKALYNLGGPTFRYASDNALGYDAGEMWGSINVPVRAVFGSRDRLVTKRDMREFQSILPSATTILIKNTGHSSLVDQPEAVAEALFGRGL